MLKEDVHQDVNNTKQISRSIIADKQIQKYISDKKELYNNLIIFLDSYDNENNFAKLVEIINEQTYDHQKFIQFLQLINNISIYHYHPDFFQKIFQIIEYYKDKIKQTFSNVEIFDIFQNSKKNLLFLFENQIISFDEAIYHKIISKSDRGIYGYGHFFYLEIKKFDNKEITELFENDLLKLNPKIFEEFDQNRHKGENDSYICSLIRNDSVKEFVSYVNRTNLSLKSEVKFSIFETHQFLIENNPTLIEYSVFFCFI